MQTSEQALKCPICEHPRRREIEQAIMSGDYGTVSMTLPAIAENFDVNPADLQIHALFHSPVVMLEEQYVGLSLTGSLKQHEADLLMSAAHEYHQTLKVVGKQIRNSVAPPEVLVKGFDDNGNPVEVKMSPPPQPINGPMVDLYLGAGTNLRQTIDSVVKMHQVINGANDNGLQALGDLFNAIRNSNND